MSNSFINNQCWFLALLLESRIVFYVNIIITFEIYNVKHMRMSNSGLCYFHVFKFTTIHKKCDKVFISHRRFNIFYAPCHVIIFFLIKIQNISKLNSTTKIVLVWLSFKQHSTTNCSPFEWEKKIQDTPIVLLKASQIFNPHHWKLLLRNSSTVNKTIYN